MFGMMAPAPPLQPPQPPQPPAPAGQEEAVPLPPDDEEEEQHAPLELTAELAASQPADPASLTWYGDAACKEALGHLASKEFSREAKSVRLEGMGHAEFFSHELFLYSLHAMDGCVRLFTYPRPSRVELFAGTPLLHAPQIRRSDLDTQRRALGVSAQAVGARPAKYRFVYSAESAEYFGYQMWANKYAFLHSGWVAAAARGWAGARADERGRAGRATRRGRGC
jgi:hypothetical protein